MDGFLNELSRPSPGNDWMALGLVMILTTFAFARLFYSRQLSRVSLAFSSMYEAHRLLTERNARVRQMSVVMYLLVIQCIAFFFVVQNGIRFGISQPIPQFLQYFLLILIISVFLLLRTLATQGLGQLFNLRELSARINQVYTVNILMLGMILILVNVFTAFAPAFLSIMAMYAGFGIFVLWALYTWVRVMQVMNRIRILLLYKILYLCAFEILPWWFVVLITLKGWS